MSGLVWVSAGTGDAGDQCAYSSTRVAPGSSRAYYLIGPHGMLWSVELVQLHHGEETGGTDLGRHPGESAAKAAALTHENGAKVSDPGAARFVWTTGQVQARDVRVGDILRDPHEKWRQVIAAWSDRNADDAYTYLARAGDNVDPDDRDQVDAHLTGMDLYVVLALLEEEHSEGRVALRLRAYRRVDLVTVQLPDRLVGVPSA